MRQETYRDEVDAGLGVGANILQANSARTFHGNVASVLLSIGLLLAFSIWLSRAALGYLPSDISTVDRAMLRNIIQTHIVADHPGTFYTYEILLAAADWAVMADGPGRTGVTELLVGVPFPAVALELLRLRAGDAQARPLALSGATFGAGEAAAARP